MLSYEWYAQWHSQPTMIQRINEGTLPLFRFVATVLGIISLTVAGFSDKEIEKLADSIPHTTTPLPIWKQDVASNPRPSYMHMHQTISYFTSVKIDELHADMQNKNFLARFSSNPVSLTLASVGSIFLALSYLIEWHVKRHKK